VRLDKDGDQEIRDAKRANQTSDNFVFGVVLYTIVLSISGVAPKLISVRVRRLVLFISIVVLISATALTLRLPMDVRAVGVRPWLSRLEVSASGLTFAQ
jgi:hypothetical protein